MRWGLRQISIPPAHLHKKKLTFLATSCGNLTDVGNTDVRGFTPDRWLANQSPLSPCFSSLKKKTLNRFVSSHQVHVLAILLVNLLQMAVKGLAKRKKGKSARHHSLLWRPSDGLVLTSAGLQAPRWDVKGQLQLLSPPCSPPWWWLFSEIRHCHCHPVWSTGGVSWDVFSVKGCFCTTDGSPSHQTNPTVLINCGLAISGCKQWRLCSKQNKKTSINPSLLLLPLIWSQVAGQQTKQRHPDLPGHVTSSKWDPRCSQANQET